MHNYYYFQARQAEDKIFTVLDYFAWHDSSNNQLKLLDYYCFADGKLCNIYSFLLIVNMSKELKFSLVKLFYFKTDILTTLQ